MKSMADSNANKIAAFGAYCVLGEQELAFDIIVSNLSDDFVWGQYIETVLDWPIITLLSAEQQEKLRRIAAGESAEDVSSGSENKSAIKHIGPTKLGDAKSAE